MIRARATNKDGKPVILLGVTRENIRRLVDMKQPIRVSGDSIKFPELASIGIWFGETEAELLEDMNAALLLDDNTTVHAEHHKAQSRLIVPDAAKRQPITIGWDSRTEKLAARVDHALLIVPQGELGHRAYFVGDDNDVGNMVAVCIALASRRNNGAALKIAQRALAEGMGEELR